MRHNEFLKQRQFRIYEKMMMDPNPTHKQWQENDREEQVFYDMNQKKNDD